VRKGLFSANVSVSRSNRWRQRIASRGDQRQVSADAAQLTLAQRRRAQWGQNLPFRTQAERTALLAEVDGGVTFALAKVTFPEQCSRNGTPHFAQDRTGRPRRRRDGLDLPIGCGVRRGIRPSPARASLHADRSRPRPIAWRAHRASIPTGRAQAGHGHPIGCGF
jgi:hypothetical protein